MNHHVDQIIAVNKNGMIVLTGQPEAIQNDVESFEFSNRLRK
jgi:hypothetical protein